MRNGRKTSLHEHVMAIGVAVLIVAAVSVGINRSGLLTADILHGNGTNATLASADIAYKVTTGTLAVKSEKIFHDAQSLTFVVVYNPDAVVVDAKGSQTAYDFTSSSGKKGSVHVTLFLSGSVSADSTFISLPFSGTTDDILIADATMLFSGGTIDSLAIQKQ